jgi:ureidoacrylate peracid hydrolase
MNLGRGFKVTNTDVKTNQGDPSFYDLADWKDYFLQSRAALLVVDPQNDVLVETASLGFWNVWKHARENNAIENNKQIIKACRAKGIPVIWAKQQLLAGGQDLVPGTWSGDLMTMIRTLIPNAFQQNTWETEIYDELAELISPQDIIICKHGSSAFEGTNLEKYLRDMNIEMILTTGFLTDFCVEATVRSACDRGYTAVAIGDACATENEKLHQKALKRIERLIGPVCNTEEMLELLEKHPAMTWLEFPTFNLEEMGSKLAQGISLNEMMDWKKYLNIEKTALLLVDPQNDNLNEKGSLSSFGYWKHAQDSRAVSNLVKLAEACRLRNIRVFWIKQNRLPGGKDIFPDSLDGKIMGLIHESMPGAFLGDTWDTDIFDELKPLIREDELIIEKATWSAFVGTALERYLNTLGITNLIMCGFLTDFCVESTARNASDRGYFTIVVKDACATTDQEDHDLALARFDRLIGPVVSTEELVEFLSK